MFIYNKSGKRSKFDSIQGRGVKVSTPLQQQQRAPERVLKIKPLRGDNIKFLEYLGYEVN